MDEHTRIGPADARAGARAAPRAGPRAGPWAWSAAWLGAGVLAAAVLLVSGRAIFDEHLRVAAERSAVDYARLIGAAVPRLAPLLERGEPTAATLAQLRRLREAGSVFGFRLFDREGILRVESDRLGRTGARVVGIPVPGPLPGGEVPPEARVLATGEPVVRLAAGDAADGRPERYGEAWAPLFAEGRLVGVIEVAVDQSSLARENRDAFVATAAVVALVTAALGLLGAFQSSRRREERRRIERRMSYLASHDALSGALNRASFTDALGAAAAEHGTTGRPFAVLCIDLDRFKEINDSRGHGAGDEVLRQATARLRSLLRAGDRLARLGGDEFAILLDGVEEVEEVRGIAGRAVAALAEPYLVEGEPVRCGGSVGAARFDDDATDLQELMHKADLALYRAKGDGRGGFSFYDAGLDGRLRERRRLAADLRAAVEGERLTLDYQDLFDADGTRVTGREALLRWRHPERGPIPPDVFVPMAEEAHLIGRLGAWVLAEACREASGWPDGQSVAVNLSAAQFQRGDIVATVRGALERSGLEPARLELEITESLLMTDTDRIVGILETLSGLGVRIAMDDFGTGYSSLAYLWRFPFDKVKIDRSFVQALARDDKVDLIVGSIVSLAHSLRIRVNAEGVETEAQLETLRGHGCDEFQGFLLARPASAAATRAALAAGKAPPDGGADASASATEESAGGATDASEGHPRRAA